jgi:excisionase family DNA binding protein
VVEMCSLLKISRATLIRMDNSGKLPGRIKLGGSVRFHRETVETWLQSLITHTS